MEPEIKVGLTIQLASAVLETVYVYREQARYVMDMMLALAEESSENTKCMWRAIRAAHPELDGWDFRVEHKTGVIVVMFPRDPTNS